MERLRKLAALSREERALLLRAALLLTGMRVALVALPFRTLQRLVARQSPPAGAAAREDAEAVERIAWAVTTAGRRVLGVRPCLAKALTAQVLLGRRGYASDLRIGVARGEDTAVRAHAWLECGGRVVVGGEELAEYVPLVSRDAETAQA